VTSVSGSQPGRTFKDVPGRASGRIHFHFNPGIHSRRCPKAVRRTAAHTRGRRNEPTHGVDIARARVGEYVEAG